MVVLNKKNFILWLFIALLPVSLFAAPNVALSPSPTQQQLTPQQLQLDKEYLRKKNDLYQMWELSNNYKYGTTVPKDPIKALAWMLIYAECLPQRYPGLMTQVSQYKQSLSDDQIREAYQMALVYRNKYHLTYSLSEEELGKIFSVGTVDFTAIDVDKKLPSLDALIKQLRSNGNPDTADKLESRYATLKLEQHFPIYYGRVLVFGSERPTTVTSNVEILPGGYFIGSYNTPTSNPLLEFKLSGYQSATKAINPAKIVQNLGAIELKPLDKKQLSNLVGRILPMKAMDHINIVLKLKDSVNPNDDEPWLSPVVPIVTLADGQYYATGLSPDEYELIISYHGQKIVRNLRLYAGETKGVDTIRL